MARQEIPDEKIMIQRPPDSEFFFKQAELGTAVLALCFFFQRLVWKA